MAEKNRFQDKISIQNIGSGKFFTAGSFNTRYRKGLAGALRKAKSAGRASYAKNLSQKDLKTFQGLIGKEVSRLSAHSKGLSRQARIRIMGQAETLRRSGQISMEDKKDLKNIVNALKGNTTTNADQPAEPKPTPPRTRATSFATDEGRKDGNALAAQHIRANIALDNAREMDDDSFLITHDPRSTLGQLEAGVSKPNMPANSKPANMPPIIPVKGAGIAPKKGNVDIKNDDNIVELDIG